MEKGTPSLPRHSELKTKHYFSCAHMEIPVSLVYEEIQKKQVFKAMPQSDQISARQSCEKSLSTQLPTRSLVLPTGPDTPDSLAPHRLVSGLDWSFIPLITFTADSNQILPVPLNQTLSPRQWAVLEYLLMIYPMYVCAVYFQMSQGP